MDVKRALAGRMVNNLLAGMDAVIESQPTAPPNPDALPPIKFMHYSAHDTTVAPLLALLDAYDGKWPPYASHVGMSISSSFKVSVIIMGSQRISKVRLLLQSLSCVSIRLVTISCALSIKMNSCCCHTAMD
jgi:hypothetical protein